MSPPNRLPAEPDSERQEQPAGRTEAHAPSPTTDVGSAHGAVLATQQAAGNRAVASVLGAPRGIQRAPNDDDEPLPMTVGTSTVTSAAPRPTSGGGAAMQVGSQTLDSAAPRPGAGGSSGAAPATPGAGPLPWVNDPMAPPMVGRAEKDPRFRLGGEFGPKPVEPGMFGGVPKPASATPNPIEVNAQNVQTQFERNPARVIRSPSPTWHEEAWHKSNGLEKFPDKPVPKAFSDGSVMFVHPDFEGTASRLPHYTGSDAGGAPGGPGSGAPAPGGGERPMARLPPERPENRLREAVSPETPAGPRGNVIAQRVTYQEVEAAFRNNPGSVFRSPNDRWHGQGYRHDGGKGGTPGVFKVGDQYFISPGYPLDNVPYLAMPNAVGPAGAPRPAPSRPGELPQAAQTVAPAGTTYREGSALRSYSTTTTEAGGRSETRTRSREQAVVTTSTEVTEGGMTNRQERQRGAGFGAGGNLLGATAGTTDTSKIEGDVVAAKKTKQVSAGLGKDMKLGAEYKSSKEIVTGTDPDGNPVKSAQQTKVGGKVDLEGNVSLAAGRDTTNQKGTTKGYGAGAKIDKKGNVELEAYYNIQTKSGLSFKPTVSRGVKVEASDPVQVEDGWEVTYRIADTTGVGLGAGKQLGGGTTVGVNVGATEADFKGGKRTFKTEDEAKAFRDNAAARVASEQIFTPNLPPTTVAGALQIPIGETRSSGDISGKSIGGSVGHSGVALNVGKSKSTTNEMAVKRTGATTVEVTGSVAGSKTGTVGISAPALTHGYSSTSTTSFAVTFEFDLSKEQGRAAFELYARTGFPPPQSPKVIERAGSESDNETFAIAGLGTVVWTGTTWNVSRETAGGGTTQVYGGAQIHEQKPGTVGRWIGEDTLKSNASITRVVKDGEEVGARAQFQVGGTSGEYNRKEFGKIFMGAKSQGDVKPSGEWTLSAPVPKENIDALHRVSRKIRSSLDERQAYSELVKEGGAAMLGGQAGGGSSKSWDLELKGDPNFPGEKERTRLKEVRTSLMARIRTDPELANDIVREANAEIAKLEKRREAVADLKRYTDLPDGLRQQQLGVIDMHIDDMKVVRRTGQSVAMKRDPREKTSDVAARLEQADAARPGAKKGGKKGGAPKATPTKAADDPAARADREYATLQDLVAAKEGQIAAKRKEIRDNSKALGDAIGAKGSTAVKFGADSATVQVAIASGKGYIGAATDADKKQAALEPQIEAARNAWSAATGREGQTAAIRALEKLLDERLKLMHSTLYFIREAGKAVFHITTKSAKSGNPAFWSSLGETEGEE